MKTNLEGISSYRGYTLYVGKLLFEYSNTVNYTISGTDNNKPKILLRWSFRNVALIL